MNTDRATVLVLEDHDGLREVLRLFLEDGGFRCLAAGSVESARSLVQPPVRVHAAVVDLLMEGEMGSSLARELVALGVPVVIVTGMSRSLAERYVPESVTILTKPADLSELMRLLHQLMPTTIEHSRATKHSHHT